MHYLSKSFTRRKSSTCANITLIIFFILGQSNIKITGTGTIVNGKTSLNINVQIDGNGGGAPKVGGGFSGKGGGFAQVVERFPGKGGRLPQIEGKIPGLGRIFPGAGGSYPTQPPVGKPGREGGSPAGMYVLYQIDFKLFQIHPFKMAGAENLKAKIGDNA